MLGLVLMGTPSGAAAHDGLLGSTPTAGETVARPPSTVELRFSGPPLPLGTEVLVTGPDGQRIDRGSAEIRDAAVVQPLSEAPGAGTYTVRWRSTSADGHPVSGSFAFDVAGAGAATPVPAAAAGAPGGAPDDGPVPPGTGWPAAGAITLGMLGTLLARRLRSRT